MLISGLYRAVRPVIRFVDPEAAHRLAVGGLSCTPAALLPRVSDDPILATRLWGLDFPNPLGLAAGFDKNAEAPDTLGRLGFGHVEIGTVTPLPQPGNPRPRLFRLAADRAVINRYGFNSRGLDVVRHNLERRRPKRKAVLVGANVGKNKNGDEISDFVAGIEALAPLADYLVVNVSSPNTPGLRDLQARDAMERLIRACQAARARHVRLHRPPPLLVKLAPDLDDAALADAAEVALATGLDGLVMGNTTLSRPPGLASPDRNEAGGLSGRPLRALAAERLARLYRMTHGRIPLIAAGGVESGADAYARIRAGASLVQLYSALVYEGPGLAVGIKRDLAALLRRDGFGSIGEAVGADGRD